MFLYVVRMFILNSYITYTCLYLTRTFVDAVSITCSLERLLPSSIGSVGVVPTAFTLLTKTSSTGRNPYVSLRSWEGKLKQVHYNSGTMTLSPPTHFFGQVSDCTNARRRFPASRARIAACME